MLAGFTHAVSNSIGRWRYFVKDRGGPVHPLPSGADAILSGLTEHGYAVVPNFYDQKKCSFLRNEIDRLIAEQPDVVQNDTRFSDQRIFGSERASSAIMDFHGAQLPLSIGEHYGKRRLVSFSTLAGRLSAKPGNLGSGQGWHRDAFHFQFKAMVYLSDVSAQNGPFQLLDASHRGARVFTDTILAGLASAPNTRLTDQQADALLRADPARLKTFVAPAGTMILFDSSTIHRGSPISTGTRYALTNYYYDPAHIVPAVIDAFAPYARASVTELGS